VLRAAQSTGGGFNPVNVVVQVTDACNGGAVIDGATVTVYSTGQTFTLTGTGNGHYSLCTGDEPVANYDFTVNASAIVLGVTRTGSVSGTTTYIPNMTCQQ